MSPVILFIDEPLLLILISPLYIAFLDDYLLLLFELLFLPFPISVFSGST